MTIYVNKEGKDIMKNIEIVRVFNELMKYSDKKMPQKISYAVTKNLLILQAEYQCYEKELKKLYASYADKTKKDEKGNPMVYENGIPRIKEEFVKEFEKDLSELLSIEADVKPYLISEDVFDYSDDTGRYDSLSPNDIVFLQTVMCEQ